MKIKLSDSTEIDIQVNTNTSDFSAQGFMDTAMTAIHFSKLDIAGTFLKDTISNLTAKLKDNLPDELEIGVCLTNGAEGNIIISKGSAEANISIKAVWKRSKNG